MTKNQNADATAAATFAHGAETQDFQGQVGRWLTACFGSDIDKEDRANRFLEEALELVQSIGGTREAAHALVDYVFDRPVGDPRQEAGGAMLTLAALCHVQSLDLDEAGRAELARVWLLVDRIRAKHASRPANSPLPGSAD